MKQKGVVLVFKPGTSERDIRQALARIGMILDPRHYQPNETQGRRERR